ncbi:hypothetical protein I547_6557 [Mycobacterium kansasii 824]|nr:hypothetical protein I547_6557 [Mycobacterium kansasii 824]
MASAPLSSQVATQPPTPQPTSSTELGRFSAANIGTITVAEADDPAACPS